MNSENSGSTGESSGGGRQYKVKLTTGRVLGPLDLERVRQLILKNHITGLEVAREYPEGDWRDINQFVPIAELLLKKASGKLKAEADLQKQQAPEPYRPLLGPNASAAVLEATQITPLQDTPEELRKIRSSAVSGGGPEKSEVPIRQSVPSQDPEASSAKKQAPIMSLPPDQIRSANPMKGNLASTVTSENQAALVEQEEGTWIGDEPPGGEKTIVGDLSEGRPTESSGSSLEGVVSGPVQFGLELENPAGRQSGAVIPSYVQNASEATRFLSRDEMKKAVESVGGNSEYATVEAGGSKQKKILQFLFAVVAILAGAHEFLTDEAEPKKPMPAVEAFVPTLPQYSQFPKPDPTRSQKEFEIGMRYYLEDTVQGYIRAAKHLKLAASAQKDNWTAHAFLLSSYLNLTESSIKDDGFLKVILPLLERIQLNAKREPFAVQVQVEFYTVMNQAEAAAAKLLDFLSNASTDVQGRPDVLVSAGLTSFSKGDYREAAKYLGGIDFSKFKVPKARYLRARTAEMLNDTDTAVAEYKEILKAQPKHAKSKLRLAWIATKAGRMKDVLGLIEDLVSAPGLLSPRDRAASYYLKGLASQLTQQWQDAVAALSRAVSLDPEESDYLLELYTVKVRAGNKSANAKSDVEMYTRLAHGQELVKAAQYHEALNEFLRAHRANITSPLPLVRIGDMFLKTNDFVNARMNYKLALDRAPRDPSIYTKYLSILVQTYEFAEADKMIQAAPQIGLQLQRAAVERARGERFARQERHAEAQRHFRKAIEMGYADSGLYIAYSKSLMQTKTPEDYRLATFYFAMALQIDPLSTEAALGNARCVAEIDGIPAAIALIRDELVKRPSAQAELLTGMAELYLKKGDVQQASAFIEQAKAMNPKYGPAYYLEFKVWQTKLNTEKDAINKGLQALETYVELSPTDPIGYIERWRQFMNKADPDMAEAELIKLYARYPKFPNYHLYMGMTLNAQGKFAGAKEQFEKELEFNPYNVDAYTNLGKNLLDQGKPGEAVNPLNQAMSIDPKRVEAKRLAAVANLALKNYQGAAALLQSAIAIDGGNPLLYRTLGNVLREMGDARGAAAAYRRYLDLAPAAPDRNEFLPFIH